MKKYNWFLDETSHAGEEHLDPDYVRDYDRKAGVTPDADVSLLRELGLDESHTLVDFGAGTGEFALAVAPFCRRVVAVDVSRYMLERLEEKASCKGVENIECVRDGFLTYEHTDDAPAFVYTRNALHHLPDFWKALALHRISCILQPGGILRLHDLVYSCAPQEAAGVIESWLGNAPASPDHGWTRSELGKDIRDEYITFDWLLEPILERAGFDIRSTHHEESRVFSAYTCVRVP